MTTTPAELTEALRAYYEHKRERLIAELHDVDRILGRAPTLETQKAKQARLRNERRAFGAEVE